MRSKIGSVTMLALATMLAGGAFVACSGNDQKSHESDKVGSIGLNLDIAPGVTVNTVSYEITGNGLTSPITGSISVTDPAATVSLLRGGLRAGGPYTITMSADSTDGSAHCGGSATFTVVAGQTTSVTVALQCTVTDNSGTVSTDVTLNSCPVLTSWTAAPLQVSTNGQIAVAAAAADLNASNTLTYSWTATAGSFVAPSSAATSYNCTQNGTQVLTVTVNDGQCTDSTTISVRCVALACGNGTVDTGETCDDGNTTSGDACPSDCTLPVCGDNVIEAPEVCDDGNTANGDNCPSDCVPAVCGNGTVESTKGEQCDPPSAANHCSSTCQNLPFCGNGTVDAGEQCDDGNTVDTDACRNNCTAPAAAVCGDGTVQAPETCERPFQVGQNCGADCQPITSAACSACEAGNECAETTNCAIVEGNAPDGTPRAELCERVLDCVRDTNCDTGLELNCYCGNVGSSACTAGNGNGACKAILERALETNLPADIFGRFVNPTYGGGLAMTRITCDNALCSSACN